jgi:hypothetical protein
LDTTLSLLSAAGAVRLLLIIVLGRASL